MLKILLVPMVTMFISTAYAAIPDHHAIEQQFLDVAQQLQDLVETKPHDPCIGDVQMVANYAGKTALKVRQQNYESALADITYGVYELQAIQQRAWCVNLVTPTKPFIQITKKISKDIDTLSRYQDFN